MKAILPLLILLAPAAAAEPQPSVLVTTARPVQGSRPERIEAYGTARPALDQATSLSEQVEGEVVAIAVTPGEIVRAGQKLLEFRPSAGTTSLYRQAVTALSAAEASRTHTAQLLAERLATRDQLQAADKAVADARSALDALRREGAAGPRSITAPVDGIVDTIPVSQGARIPPGTPLLTLTARNGLVVTVGVDPAERPNLATGDAVSLTRLTGGPTLEGQVLRIDGVLDPRTRMVNVDVSVPPDQILSGEAFRAAITLRMVEGWLVPHEAVLAGKNGASVFQVAGGKGVQVGVTVRLDDGDTDVVTGAIDPARPLVVDGAYQLSNGMAVRTGKPS